MRINKSSLSGLIYSQTPACQLIKSSTAFVFFKLREFFFAKQRGSGKRNLKDASMYFTLWGKGIRLEAPPTRKYQPLN